jgi:hypothetical protein
MQDRLALRGCKSFHMFEAGCKIFRQKYSALGEHKFVDSMEPYFSGPHRLWHVGCSGTALLLNAIYMHSHTFCEHFFAFMPKKLFVCVKP